MSIKQVISLVQFTRGTNLVWDALVTPLPDGVVSFSIDDGVFKIGDGTTLYQDLPILFTYDDMLMAQNGTSAMFEGPTVAKDDHIVVIAFDVPSGVTKYAISSTTLTSLMASLNAIDSTNTAQDAAIAQLLSAALSIDASINTGSDGNIIVINNDRYVDSGSTVAAVQAQIESLGGNYIPGSHLMEPIFYTTVDKTVVVDKTQLVLGITYYVDVVGFNNDYASPVFGLTSTNTNITIAHVAGSLFTLTVNAIHGRDGVNPMILIASVDGGDGQSTVRKAIVVVAKHSNILISTLSGADFDQFAAVVVDTTNNIIAVGYTKSESASYDELIVKFDQSLNILSKKRCGGSGDDYLMAVTVDKFNDIDSVWCGGWTASEGSGSGAGLALKLDKSLVPVYKNIVSKTSASTIIWDVAFGSDLKMHCAGTANNYGEYIQYDNALGIAKQFQTTLVGTKFLAIALDQPNSMAYLAGYYGSGPPSMRAYITKWSSGASPMMQWSKEFGDDIYPAKFSDVVQGPDGSIYVVGNIASPSTIGIILKYNQNGDVIGKRLFTTNANDTTYFNRLTFDKYGDIIVVGQAVAAAAAFGIVVKFDKNLNTLGAKSCVVNGGCNLADVTIDKFGNIIVVGFSRPSSNNDAMIIKFGSYIPAGTFSGTALPTISLNDISYTDQYSINPAITSNSDANTLSTLTAGASAYSPVNSALTQVTDVFG